MLYINNPCKSPVNLETKKENIMTDYAALSLTELKEEAKKRGLKGISTMRKPEKLNCYLHRKHRKAKRQQKR